MQNQNDLTQDELRVHAEKDAEFSFDMGELTDDSVVIAQMALRHLQAVVGEVHFSELTEEAKALYIVTFAATVFKRLS
jgi:hypothetical protein